MYVAYIPFDILPVAFGRTLTGPLALLLILTWIMSNLRRPEQIFFPRSAAVFLFLYLFWIIFTIFWSVDASSSIETAQTYVLQVPLVVILSQTLRDIWLRALVTLGCSTAFLALAVLSSPADALRGGRANVGGIDENVTAMVLVAGFAALVYAVSRLGGGQSALLVPAAILTGAATLHTGSRSGAIAAVSVLVVTVSPLILRERRRPAVWFRAVGILLLAYFAFMMAVDIGLLPPRVLNLFSESTAYGDTGRSDIINLYLQTFSHWVFFGVGLGNDAEYLYMTQSTYLNAHSLFWKTWIESGLVGLTLFAAFLTVVIKRGFQSVASDALISLAVSLGVFAITLSGATTSVFWFVVALALTERPSAQQPHDGSSNLTGQCADHG